jgi:hypothetical protein
MIDEQIAQMRTHRNNIDRYRRLLRTRLTELESQFIKCRMAEEQAKLERLTSATFP